MKIEKVDYLSGLVIGVITSFVKANVLFINNINPIIWDWLNTGVKAFIGGCLGFLATVLMKKIQEMFKRLKP
jgi:hypothetical protein